MLVTPIQARERSIVELTGTVPAKGTRMYVRQRQYDPQFRDDTYIENQMPPQQISPPGYSTVPRVNTIHASPGKTLLDQYVDSGLVELPSTMKPWQSPWDAAQEYPEIPAAPVTVVVRGHSHVMHRYRTPRQPQHESTVSFQRTGSTVHHRTQTAPAALVKSRELVIQTTGRKARGAVMFDRMKKRSDQYVTDESNVTNTTDHYSQRRIQMLQQTRQRAPSPPPHMGTGYTPPPPQPTTHTDAPRYKPNIKSPWEAAEHNPVGSVEEAFYKSRRNIDPSLVNNVKEAARTKAERNAYGPGQPWMRTTYDEQRHGQVSFSLPPRVTSAPRLRLGATPYENDFNIKPQGWAGVGYHEDTLSDVTDYHTLPKARPSRHRAGDFNPRPKSWNPAGHVDHQEFHHVGHDPHHLHDDIDDEEPAAEQEHLKPVRMTAKKFDRPQHRRRSRPVKPVAGPKIWNPSTLEETDDL